MKYTVTGFVGNQVCLLQERNRLNWKVVLADFYLIKSKSLISLIWTSRTVDPSYCTGLLLIMMILFIYAFVLFSTTKLCVFSDFLVRR